MFYFYYIHKTSFKVFDLHTDKIPWIFLWSWLGYLSCTLWQCDNVWRFESYSLQDISQKEPNSIKEL